MFGLGLFVVLLLGGVVLCGDNMVGVVDLMLLLECWIGLCDGCYGGMLY